MFVALTGYSFIPLKCQKSMRLPRVYGGDDRSRTGDPRLAKPMLYQLSYIPHIKKPESVTIQMDTHRDGPIVMVGLTRVELVTSRLSGVRSNQLSYRPTHPLILQIF